MNMAILLSGGTGTRIKSSIPKQYIEAGGEMIIARPLRILLTHPEIEEVYVVADEEWQERILEAVAAAGKAADKMKGFASPGVNRQGSIRNALRVIMPLRQAKGPDDLVIVHDAARPNVTAELISACFEACREHDGAMPVLPMKDTVYLGKDGKVGELLDRSRLFAGQAPEAFRLDKYYEANEALGDEDILKINGSTEAAIRAGMDVVMIEGDEKNYKITTDEDLERYCETVASTGVTFGPSTSSGTGDAGIG